MKSGETKLSRSYRWDALHYDLQYNKFASDIPFWIGCADKYGGRVLELACGSGRITLPLARSGARVTGLDQDRRMLELARKKAAREGVEIEFIKADCRDFALGEKFPLIILPFNSIQFICYTRSDLKAFFGCVGDHLEEGGRLILDLLNPPVKILANPPNGRSPIPSYPDPEGRGMICVTESDIVYDSAAQIWSSKWSYRLGGSVIKTEELSLRLYYPQEIDAAVEHHGFRIENKLADYFGGRFTAESHKQIIVCRRAE